MEMCISDLSHRTIEELYSALENPPTCNWKTLMQKPFHKLYSDKDINVIETRKGCRPAKMLLDDLIHREITLRDLLNGLKEIGNNRAVSIIKKETKKNAVDIQDSGGRPPPSLDIRQATEHSMARSSCTSPLQRREQSETLLQFPVQESATNGGRPCDLGLQVYMVEFVTRLFPCLQIYN